MTPFFHKFLDNVSALFKQICSNKLNVLQMYSNGKKSESPLAKSQELHCLTVPGKPASPRP